MEELTRIIENDYGYKIEGIEKIKNAYKIRTDIGNMCFKACKYDLKQFDFIIQVILHLHNRGYESVVPIKETQNGSKYVKYKSGYGFLCDWLDSREANFDNSIELKACIESLGKLHLASMGFEYKINSSIRNQYGKWVNKFKKRCEELLYFIAIARDKKKHTEFDHLYIKYFEKHYKQGLKAIRDLETTEYITISQKHKQQAGFCHHDTANHNFLITPEFKIYLIDFDYCIFDTYLHDLGSLIIRNLKHGNWRMEKMDYILNIYNQIIQINKEDLKVIFCFMEFPQDFWQIGLQYYVEKQQWEEEIFIKKLVRVTNDSGSRFEFLKNFQGGKLLEIN